MSQGTKHDQGKPRLTLVDPDFVEKMAKILDQGEQRYGEGNWKQGLKYSRLLDAARRHLAAIEKGEDIDPDSGMEHAAHVACSMMFLQYFQENNRRELDDRNYAQVPSLRRADSGDLSEPSAKVGLHLQDVQQQKEETLEGLQERVTAWADRVFPDRNPYNALNKMVAEEIPELIQGGLDDPLEFADVLIMLVDIAYLQGVDIVEAAHRKQSINERRSWKQNPNTGLYHHVN